MTARPRDVVLVADSRLDEVAAVGSRVREIVAGFGLDPDAAAEVELCVIEAATNAVRHGYGGAPGRPVVVRIEVRSRCIRVEVCDQGRGIPAEARRPSMPDPLAESGRGLPLLWALMDHVRFSHRDGWHVVGLARRLPSR